MKQNEVKTDGVYLTRINRRLVRVRVKSTRKDSLGKTLFVTVREVPAEHEGGLMAREFPRTARELRPLPVRDLSGDPAHDTAAGGEPVPERGDQ